MKFVRAIRLLLLCGLFVLCVNYASGRHNGSDRNTVGDGSTQKLNYKNLSKHLLKRLDSSCKNSLHPEIDNGKFVKFRKAKIEGGNPKSKRYLVAEFRCNEGYKFRNSHPKKMFCSKKKWVGKKPICDKIENGLDDLQGDDPNAASPQLFSELEKCSPEDQVKCKYVCRIYNGQPHCDCPKGLEKVGNECKDIDECKTNNGGCSHTCINILGSFSCSCGEGFRLSSDGVTCEDVNECHLRNGHGPCQDTCENTYGSYKCSCINLKGTRLGSDWHTCMDVNECTEGIAGCSHGCINARGRVFCTCPDGMELGLDWKTCHDVLNDQPDNETSPRDDEDEYDDEDYEEDYDEENYKDEENNDEYEKDPKQQKEYEESTRNNDKGSDKGVEQRTVIKEETESPPVMATVAPVIPLTNFSEKSADDNDEYESYDDDEYDDEYEEESEDNSNKVNSKNDRNQSTVIENKTEGTTSMTNIHISGEEEEGYDTTYNTRINSIQPPNKEIQNRADENYDESSKQLSRTGDSNTDSELSLTKVENTTSALKPDIIKKIDDTLEEEYDEDYDEEYYDKEKQNNRTKETDTDKDDDKTENHSRAKLPDVDIAKVNTDIHEIIKNSTENIYNVTEETKTTITSKSQETTEVNKINDGDDYETEDYEEEEDDEFENGESIPKENEVTKCEKGYILRADGECSDLDECQTNNPCSNGCENTIGSYRCTCPTGFTISSSDPHSCRDINECLDNPCSHICVNNVGSFHCECPSGLTLENNTCMNLTCSYGQTKVNSVVQCTCPTGYVLGSDNRTCEDMDECLLNICSDICRNTIGSFECACEAGYELKNGRTCVDIDECQRNHGCPQLCLNSPGSFKCSCEEGYEYNEKDNSCVDVNECDEELDLDECNQICVNYEGGYECACYTGYKLGTDDATCEDINECSTNNGNCSQICTNQPGSYLCECNTGYKLSSDNATCEISDPCFIENGGCSHECLNENGTAVCRCPEGQVLEGKDCYKIDPCVADNGGCSHDCVNANGAVRCECPKGYELENETTCVQINLCTISNGNCSHFCEFVDGHVNCMCPDMYVLQNKTQCVEMNPCEDDNGGCSHVCNFENHTVVCSCPSTYELRNKTHCFERNPCLKDNGGCSDVCHFANGVLSCSCPENYYLEGKTCYRVDPCLSENGGCSHECLSDDQGEVECLCPETFHLKYDKKTCTPKNPCLVNNGNCSHICDFYTVDPICSCPEGFKLRNKTHCEELNPCLMENGGCSHTCENFNGQAKCLCPDHYVLVDTTNCVAKDPCLENNGGCSHECTNVDDKAQCSCPDHYNLENGTTCVPVNPCLINNGGCSHECLYEEGEVYCICPEGYKLHGRNCVAVNLCDTKNGGCSHVCSSINGQVICKCPPGFELIDKTCFKVNPCSLNNGGCSHSCTKVDGQAKCSCPPGYKLFGKQCSDEDPCTKHNGGCSHYCHNREGKRECSCPPGYLLRPNKRVCKDVNECRMNQGGCSHGCKNLPGSYQCTCPHGFTLDARNNRTCVDVDECQSNNGNCQMICRNFKGGFRCDCPEGYIIQKDKRTCKLNTAPARCHILKPPRNGMMKCLENNSDINKSVLPGTKCNLWCKEGFKMEGSPQRLCNNSGVWEGEEPLCVAASCPMLPDIKNGWYLPGICNSNKVYLGESCKLHCKRGYKRNIKTYKYVCGEDLQWSPLVESEALSMACVRAVSNVYIKCPGNGALEFVLPQGQRQMIVKIPKPESNVDFDSYVTSYPSWGMRLETTLPAGRSEVRFTAMAASDFSSSTATCTLTINVVDKEPPRMMGCPENIERTLLNGENMQIVHWREPTFHDNVGIATTYKSREPGSEFGLGLHHISYVASDEAGNRAFCHFTVYVRGEQDSDIANSIRQQETYANHDSAGRYRAVLICPSGVHYMPNSPDSYNNDMTSEAGCYWRHIRVTRPIEPQSFRIPKVYSESRLPPNVRTNRRVFFKWNR